MKPSTLTLMRRNPILSLPVLSATALGYGVIKARLWLIHYVLPYTAVQHSVLGPMPHGVASTQMTILTGATISVLAEIIEVALLVFAMIFTARLVIESIAAADLPKDDLPRISKSSEIIARTIFLVLVIVGLASAIFFLLIYQMILHTHFRLSIKSLLEIGLPTWLAYSTVAVLMTPIAMRLVARTTNGEIDGTRIERGRKFALMTAATIAVLTILQLIAARSFNGSFDQESVFSFISTLIIASPYIPLFIAFALLCREPIAVGPSDKDAPELTGNPDAIHP